MNRKIKTILAFALVFCTMSALVVSAAGADGLYSLDMTNLESGKISFYQNDGYLTIRVTTTSLAIADELFHTITVYKNNKEIFSDSFSKDDVAVFRTSLNFGAVEGDFFKVVVDHSARTGTLVETKTTTAYTMYE